MGSLEKLLAQYPDVETEMASSSWSSSELVNSLRINDNVFISRGGAVLISNDLSDEVKRTAINYLKSSVQVNKVISVPNGLIGILREKLLQTENMKAELSLVPDIQGFKSISDDLVNSSIEMDEQYKLPFELSSYPSIGGLILKAESIYLSRNLHGLFCETTPKDLISKINQECHRLFSKAPKWVRSTTDKIDHFRKYYGDSLIKEFDNKTQYDDPEADISPLFTEIMSKAIENNASDVKINIRKKGSPSNVAMKIRDDYVDLELRNVITADSLYGMLRSVINSYLSRKNAGHEDFRIDEPQDFQIPYIHKGRQINIRFSSLPSEQKTCSITLRIPNLNQNSEPKPLDELGFEPVQVHHIKEALKGTGGIFFAGATGSGKTTAIASCLGYLPPYTPVVTMQDPIEINLERPVMTHVPIDDESSKMNWSRISGQVLRHNPKVIMIGEIRLDDVASALVKMADTGHLTITTVHVESALYIPRRLSSFNIPERDLKNDTLFKLLVAVKVVDTLCADCKLPLQTFKPKSLSELRVHNYFQDDDNVFCRNPDGCRKCGYSGLQGRTLFAEVLVHNSVVMRLIFENDINGARKLLKETGWISLEDHAERKVRRGLVCPFIADSVIQIKFGSSALDQPIDYRAIEHDVMKGLVNDH